ncbi:hypothetical protein GIB67_021057 [Kingdonia uniflora]|uniref:Uncharacterized protein n=1 Tax=Kingdonia uniflora TaxID=39325 RepID=A0A7J7N7M6_9MAGN|nr:hypothetical protein GIB67_021057 [Kingdonia uniflora]
MKNHRKSFIIHLQREGTLLWHQRQTSTTLRKSGFKRLRCWKNYDPELGFLNISIINKHQPRPNVSVAQVPPRNEVIDSFQAVQKYGGRAVVEYRTTMPVRNPYY